MKKQLFIISIVVIIVSIFVSCSAKSGSEDISTTAVTDSKGTTHYYEPVTDDKGSLSTTGKNQGVFAEIETDASNKAVTEKNGTYVTNEHTTVLPIESEKKNTSSTKKQTTAKAVSDIAKDGEAADNNIEFEPDKTTAEAKPDTTSTTTSTTTEKETTKATTESTTKKETQPATDKDGWITKWY